MTDSPPPQDFLVWLASQSEGRTATELTDGLAELVRRVKDTGKKGSISLTVAVEPLKGSDNTTFLVKDSINLKLPEFDRSASVYFADDDGGLHRNDPRQMAWGRINFETGEVTDNA